MLQSGVPVRPKGLKL